MDSISSTNDVSFEGKPDVPIAANFLSVLEKEKREMEEFKKNAPKDIYEKLEVFDQYWVHLNKIFCAIIRGTGFLFCIENMIRKDDPMLKQLPSSSIEAMKGFIDDLDSGDSLPFEDSQSVEISVHDTMPVKYDVPIPQISVAIFSLADYIVKNKLEASVITHYPELSEKDKYFINCLRMFRKACLEKINEYKKLIYQSSDYFKNLRKADQEFRKRLSELEASYKSMVQSHNLEKEFHMQRQNKAINEHRVAKELHEVELENERLKNEVVINKSIRQSLEERANRLQQLENMQQHYEKTVQKDIKRYKALRETRYKREMAVLNMIEKYDRDYGAEFNRWEKLNDQYLQLIEKSAKIDRETKQKITEYFPIFVLIAVRKKRILKNRKNRCAKIIQIWWRRVVERKKLEASISARSKTKHPARRHSRRSRYLASPPPSAMSAHESKATLHPQNAKRVRVIVPAKVLKRSSRSILGQDDEGFEDVDPLQPKSPDALHPVIDGKELVSIAEHLKLRLAQKKKKKTKMQSLKATKKAAKGKKTEIEIPDLV